MNTLLQIVKHVITVKCQEKNVPGLKTTECIKFHHCVSVHPVNKRTLLHTRDMTRNDDTPAKRRP